MDAGAAVPPCETVAAAEVEDATGTIEDELGAVAVGCGALAVALVAESVEIPPVITLPVIGGEFSKLDVGDGVEVGSWLADVPEEVFEPPAIEVIAKAGLALPESPIKTMM